MNLPSPAGTQFAIYYAGDAYSTANKIMGRQSSGKSFMRGVVRTWPDADLVGVGADQADGEAMNKQLRQEGYRGKLDWVNIPHWQALGATGTIYYPSPSAKPLAYARNMTDPAAVSFMGVTFTLSSAGAMDQVAELVFPPFKPWDAMICISECARVLCTQLQDETKAWWTAQTGATRFNTPQLPVILLGIDAPSFVPRPGQREQARAALQLADDEVAFLFAGRLAMHAKANPGPMYMALEQVARQHKVVCVEAGVFPNPNMRKVYLEAHQALAPSVRFLTIDGNDSTQYQQAWQGADVFVSLSDNIQETFGLTPVEAMAAGLPVVVSDWNGYKETIRDGVDGIRVPTALPPAGAGQELAMRHALGRDNYDMYIGRASMVTVVDPQALAHALGKLAADPALRAAMGAAGMARAQAEFDWPVILPRYQELAQQLDALRKGHAGVAAEPWPARADPFARFAHFPTQTLGLDWQLVPQPDIQARWNELQNLYMANYAFDNKLMSKELVNAMAARLQAHGQQRVDVLLHALGQATPQGLRCIMWMWKFGLLQARP